MKRTKQYLIGFFIMSLMLLPITVSMAADNSTVTATAAKEIVVTIKDFAFNPAEVTITPGTKVTWINQDTVGHNVVFTDTSGPLLKKGESWSRVFDKTGTFPYMCGPHHFMKATIIVK